MILLFTRFSEIRACTDKLPYVYRVVLTIKKRKTYVYGIDITHTRSNCFHILNRMVISAIITVYIAIKPPQGSRCSIGVVKRLWHVIKAIKADLMSYGKSSRLFLEIFCDDSHSLSPFFIL